MNVSQSLVVGIGVALFVWVLKVVVTSVMRRKALKDALLADIRSRIGQADTNEQFLRTLIEQDIKAGCQVPYTANFEPSSTTLFDALLSELISLLPDHFANLSKIYAAFKELEQLLAGILRDLTIWKETGKRLDADDVRYLRAKRERISSYVLILKAHRIAGLRDLPTDYRGIHGTEAITGTIPSVSAPEPAVPVR